MTSFFVKTFDEFVEVLKKLNPKVVYVRDSVVTTYENNFEIMIKINGLNGLTPTIYVQGSDPFKLDLIISQGLEKLGFKPVEMFRKGSSIWSKWIKQ